MSNGFVGYGAHVGGIYGYNKITNENKSGTAANIIEFGVTYGG
jgi:hypothetical protein